MQRSSIADVLRLAFFLLLAVSCLLLPYPVNAQGPSPFAVDKLPGRPAPDFTLNDLKGNPVSLSSFKGKTVLLKFWATWCPPCREEIPSINSLDKLLKNRGLVILAVSADSSTPKVADFLKKNPVTYTILIDDTQRVTKSLYKAFKLPMSFLIDKKGFIVRDYIYVHDWMAPEVIKDIEAHL